MASNVSVEAETDDMSTERVERNHREVLKTTPARREAAVGRLEELRGRDETPAEERP